MCIIAHSTSRVAGIWRFNSSQLHRICFFIPFAMPPGRWVWLNASSLLSPGRNRTDPPRLGRASNGPWSGSSKKSVPKDREGCGLKTHPDRASPVSAPERPPDVSGWSTPRDPPSLVDAGVSGSRRPTWCCSVGQSGLLCLRTEEPLLFTTRNYLLYLLYLHDYD